MVFEGTPEARSDTPRAIYQRSRAARTSVATVCEEQDERRRASTTATGCRSIYENPRPIKDTLANLIYPLNGGGPLSFCDLVSPTTFSPMNCLRPGLLLKKSPLAM